MAERNRTLTSGDFRHMDHCVEYIRQVRLSLDIVLTMALTELAL